MYLWRISKFADLSGNGGALRSGRWHQRGTPVVHCSDHPSTALLEVLVHLDFEDFPASYTLLKIACPDDLLLHAVDSWEVDLDDFEKRRLLEPAFCRKATYAFSPCQASCCRRHATS